MRSFLRKCTVCNRYTLKELCICGLKTKNPIPARYSPEDQYGKYRRKLIREIL